MTKENPITQGIPRIIGALCQEPTQTKTKYILYYIIEDVTNFMYQNLDRMYQFGPTNSGASQ